MLAEDELSEYLLKKTNYSKTKTIVGGWNVNIFVRIGFGGNSRSRDANTDWLTWIFLQKATSKYTKNLPAKLDSREIANFLAWVQLCHKTAPVAGLKPPIFAKW